MRKFYLILVPMCYALVFVSFESNIVHSIELKSQFADEFSYRAWGDPENLVDEIYLKYQQQGWDNIEPRELLVLSDHALTEIRGDEVIIFQKNNHKPVPPKRRAPQLKKSREYLADYYTLYEAAITLPKGMREARSQLDLRR